MIGHLEVVQRALVGRHKKRLSTPTYAEQGTTGGGVRGVPAHTGGRGSGRPTTKIRGGRTTKIGGLRGPSEATRVWGAAAGGTPRLGLAPGRGGRGEPAAGGFQPSPGGGCKQLPGVCTLESSTEL